MIAADRTPSDTSSRRRRAPRCLVRVALILCTLPGLVACSTATSGHFAHACVAADQPIASEAGAEILRQGGNAVDAAVATSFTLSVVRPYSCGIGGGGFMVVYFPDHPRLGRVVEAINYRETCPAAVDADFFERPADPPSSLHGASAVGVPGTVAGLLDALERYGTLDRRTVMGPAIRAARSGFIVDQHYADSAAAVIKDFEKHTDWKRRFAFVWTRYLREGSVKVGDRIRNPEQGAALELIAEHGAAAFYDGPIARAIVESIARDGGPLTAQDLRDYRASLTEPLAFAFQDKRVLTMPPPSSGGVALAQILGIVAINLPQASFCGTPAMTAPRRPFYPSVAYPHVLTEAMKHAFADRAEWMGDPAFVDVPVDRLLSPGYIKARAETFDPFHTLPSDRYGTRAGDRGHTPIADDHGTSHFCVVDAAGNAVACTETINLEFGSLLAVGPFGFCLNNEMDDFLTRRGKANAFGLRQSERNLPAPGKRPLSSMCPTIVLDQAGRVELVAGGSGGPRIISGTAQVILNVLLAGKDARAAVAAPRIHHQWQPDTLYMEGIGPGEDGGCRAEAGALGDRGHHIEPIGTVANVQLVVRSRPGERDNPRGGWRAACDPRKGGRPAGY